jgi:hypothetical protein
VNYYASVTRTKRNLAAFRLADWRLLLSPSNPKPPAGWESSRFAIDNGAWTAYTKNLSFPGDAFLDLVRSRGALADWIAIPDKVADSKSLEFSRAWLSQLRANCSKTLLLLPLQDGMKPDEVGAFVRTENVGLFLGGSDEWKLRTMHEWGAVAHALGCYYHVARVNTIRRTRLAAEAGADSIDGTSGTRFAVNVPILDNARRQPSMLSPALMSMARQADVPENKDF